MPYEQQMSSTVTGPAARAVRAGIDQPAEDALCVMGCLVFEGAELAEVGPGIGLIVDVVERGHRYSGQGVRLPGRTDRRLFRTRVVPYMNHPTHPTLPRAPLAPQPVPPLEALG